MKQYLKLEEKWLNARENQDIIVTEEDMQEIYKLQNKIDNLSKGIDELVKKCEEKLSEYSKLLKEANDNENILGAMQYQAICNHYGYFIQDLKKLKGE